MALVAHETPEHQAQAFYMFNTLKERAFTKRIIIGYCENGMVHAIFLNSYDPVLPLLTWDETSDDRGPKTPCIRLRYSKKVVRALLAASYNTRPICSEIELERIKRDKHYKNYGYAFEEACAKALHAHLHADRNAPHDKAPDMVLMKWKYELKMMHGTSGATFTTLSKCENGEA